MSQLSLLQEPPIAVAKPVLRVESVPPGIRLGKNRYFAVLRDGDRLLWVSPVQMTSIEAHAVLKRLERFAWELDASGVPLEICRINAAIEAAIDGQSNIAEV